MDVRKTLPQKGAARRIGAKICIASRLFLDVSQNLMMVVSSKYEPP